LFNKAETRQMDFKPLVAVLITKFFVFRKACGQLFNIIPNTVALVAKSFSLPNI